MEDRVREVVVRLDELEMRFEWIVEDDVSEDALYEAAIEYVLSNIEVEVI